jgi:hypothetical protein
VSKKTQQLQIRVSREEKQELRRRARRAGQDLSSYVLSRVLPAGGEGWARIVRGLRTGEDRRFWLAELSDLLTDLTHLELGTELADAEIGDLSPFLRNYVAAMVEEAARLKGTAAPPWVREVEPLPEPWFASPLAALRPHLLTAAPVAFKRRNLFVDASVGDRV